MGAALGGLWGGWLHRLAPGTVVEAGGYALVGMAALLAATTHAPLMAIVMAFEMTLDYQIILPLMLACVIASSVAHGLGSTPVYDLGGKKRARQRAADAAGRTIDAILQRDPPSVPLSAPFSHVVQAFLGARFNHLFVVDAGGRFAGAIALHDIKPHLGDGGLDGMVLAADLVGPIPSVGVGASVAEAIEQLSRHQGNRLPVLDPAGRLIGCVHKLDLHLAFATATAEAR
jgi:CIC family chloride channel protein